MSTLVAQTISNGTVSTSSANVIQGSAKAWVNFAGASGAIRASYNVSSVTRNSLGNYTVNFTNALVDSNFTASTSGDGNPTGWGAIQYEISRTSSTYRFVNVNNQIAGSGSDDATTVTATFTR